MNILKLTDAEYDEILRRAFELWGCDVASARVIPATTGVEFIVIPLASTELKRLPWPLDEAPTFGQVRIDIDTALTDGIRGGYDERYNILVIQRVT